MTWTGQTGPKFTDTEREGILERVAQMDRRGYTQWEIAKAIQVGQSQVNTYLKKIRAEYQSRRFTSMDASREEKRAQYGDIRREAWEQYQKCVEGDITVTEEHEMVKVPKAIPDHLRGGRTFRGLPAPKTHEELEMRLKRTIIKSGSNRAAAAQFLAIIMKCLDAEREMDGLVAKAIAIIPTQPTLDWDALIRKAPTPVQAETGNPDQLAIADGGPIDGADEIEARLTQLEAEAAKFKPPEDGPANGQAPSTNGNGDVH